MASAWGGWVGVWVRWGGVGGMYSIQHKGAWGGGTHQVWGGGGVHTSRTYDVRYNTSPLRCYLSLDL